MCSFVKKVCCNSPPSAASTSAWRDGTLSFTDFICSLNIQYQLDMTSSLYRRSWWTDSLVQSFSNCGANCVVANSTCLTLSERGPWNSSWKGIGRGRVVAPGLEHHTGDVLPGGGGGDKVLPGGGGGDKAVGVITGNGVDRVDTGDSA
ncbi:hypothetical protein TNCV_820781 [Trichonephila clavipes]|nr:hypothetical protein TNCV_820781 [Trichonephila clavipes]